MLSGIQQRLGRMRRRSVLGMDIGAAGVRLALLTRQRGEIRVEWTGEVDLSEMQGFSDFEAVASRLAPLLHEAGLRRLEVAAVPPWNSARVAVEELPAMSAERFEKATAWYFKRNESGDMLHPLERGIPQAARAGADGHDVMEGLMVSMDKVMVTELEQLCTGLDLRLGYLAPQPLCYAPLLPPSLPGADGSMVLDVGSAQSRMALLFGGSVRLTRKLKPCSQDIVRHLCDENGLDWQQASAVLRHHMGVPSPATPELPALIESTRPVVQAQIERLAKSLAHEIERSASYVAARHKEDVESLLLSGGLAGSEHFRQCLSDLIDLPVRTLDPFLRARGEVADETRGAYALAAGAALLALEGPPEANLLSSGRRRSRAGSGRRPIPAVSPTLGIAAVLGGLILGIGGMELRLHREREQLSQQRHQMRRELDDLRRQADRFVQRESLFEVEGTVEAVKALYASRPLFTPYLTRIVSALPRDVWLTQVDVERAHEADGEIVAGNHATVTLKGGSRRVESVGELLLELERQEFLGELEVLDIEEAGATEGAARGEYRFELSGRAHLLAPPESLALGEAGR